MAVGATAVQHGINLLQAGLFRGPAVLGAFTAATMVGECVLRGLSLAASQIPLIGQNLQEPTTETGKAILKALRPFRAERNTQALLIKGVAIAALSTAWFHVAGWAFGPAPAIYNKVLAWLGPVQISNAMHPGLAALGSMLAARGIL